MLSHSSTKVALVGGARLGFMARSFPRLAVHMLGFLCSCAASRGIVMASTEPPSGYRSQHQDKLWPILLGSGQRDSAWSPLAARSAIHKGAKQ